MRAAVGTASKRVAYPLWGKPLPKATTELANDMVPLLELWDVREGSTVRL